MAHLLALSLAALLLSAASGAPAEPAVRNLVVHPHERSDFRVPRGHSALGIEFLNHEIYGGLSSQMLFGESFEEVSLAAEVRRSAGASCRIG